MQTFKRNPLVQAIAAITFGSLASAAGAQIEEVVVTAQKKSESLQDTPIAISAFTSDNLEQIGAFSAVDIGEYTPNAVITRSLGSTYNIRGGEFYSRGKRAFPSYTQTGPSFGIEKSKQRMIAEDIATALKLVQG